jgi:hypothetical protein
VCSSGTRCKYCYRESCHASYVSGVCVLEIICNLKYNIVFFLKEKLTVSSERLVTNWISCGVRVSPGFCIFSCENKIPKKKKIKMKKKNERMTTERVNLVVRFGSPRIYNDDINLIRHHNYEKKKKAKRAIPQPLHRITVQIARYINTEFAVFLSETIFIVSLRV